MHLHVYLKYGKDDVGDYIEKLYSPILVPEDESLEYIGEIDSVKTKIDFNADTRTYI